MVRVSYIGTTQFFISLMKFLLCILVSSTFLVLLKYSFLNIFLSSLLVWECQPPVFPNNSKFPFLQAFWFAWFGCAISSVISHIPLFIISWKHIQRQIPSLFTTVIRVSYSFSFLAAWCRPCTFGVWFLRRFTK